MRLIIIWSVLNTMNSKSSQDGFYFPDVNIYLNNHFFLKLIYLICWMWIFIWPPLQCSWWCQHPACLQMTNEQCVYDVMRVTSLSLHLCIYCWPWPWSTAQWPAPAPPSRWASPAPGPGLRGEARATDGDSTPGWSTWISRSEIREWKG